MLARHLENTPDRLACVRSGKFLVHYDQSEGFAEAVAAVLSEPDRLFAAGQSIRSPWKSSATDKTVVQVGGSRYFLKRYNCQGRGYRLKNIFRTSRALKSWWAAWKFMELGLPTPAPIVCLEERRFRLLGSSYLLLEFCEDSRSLLELWGELSDNRRAQLLTLIAQVIGEMHRQGVLHGDLNWRNILVGSIGEEFSCRLVDLDGCRLLARPDRRVLEHDLVHFFRDMERNEAPEELRSLFLQLWRRKAYVK